MTPEAENAIASTARAALSEFTSKTNTLTYRQVLEKHAIRIAPLIPTRHEPWMWLNCVAQRISKQNTNH